jgi:hypothetical protein
MFKKLKDAMSKKPAYYVRQEISVPIYKFNIQKEVSNDSILERASALRKDNSESNRKKLIINSYQTDYMTDKESFSDLAQVIESKAQLITGKKYKILHYWFVFYNKGGSQKLHNHVLPNTLNELPLSAVYYPTVGNNTAPIIFKTLEKNSNDLLIPVEKGTLLIFHSELLHYVPESISDDLRVVFSCNLQ